MAQKEACQLKPVYPVTPTTASCSGFLILCDRGADRLTQRFNFFLERIRDFLSAYDQDGSIASDGAAVSGNLAAFHCGGERLRAAGGRLQTRRFSAGRKCRKEIRTRARAREGKPLDSSGKPAAGR